MNNEIVEKLLKLATRNPDLPIKAFVYNEVVAEDDYSYWLGDITDVDVDEVWLDPNDNGRTWKKKEVLFDFDDFFEHCAPEAIQEECIPLTAGEADKIADKWFESLPWKKCILLTVDTPDL